MSSSISPPTLEYEKKYWHQHCNIVTGVDEVGRGCLAGPVVAGAATFSSQVTAISGVQDSKLLTAAQRSILVDQITSQAESWAIGIASVDEINTIGIVNATFLAMERALQQLPDVAVVLVDGSMTPLFSQLRPICVETIIKGDRLSYSIAAASILAKVHRDTLMHELAQDFPLYGWGKNVGYGTKAHREAILKHGLSQHHRTLFCRNIMKIHEEHYLS